MDNLIKSNIFTGMSDMTYNPTDDSENYLYIGGGIRRFVKRRQSVKDRKMSLKEKKVQGRVDAKTGRVAAKNVKAQSKIADAQSDAELAKAITPTKKSNTGLYVGIGVGALLLIGAAFYFLKKKK